MIVTIDGPAGAGKSSIARRVADAIGFEFLDTGALYRALTLAAIRRGVDFDDRPALVAVAVQASLTPAGSQIFLDDEDVSELIRSPTVTASIVHVADVAEIRTHLNRVQRSFAAGRDIVTEGRDQGSEVFPDAECKIFLTASPAERAKRRWQQLMHDGKPLDLEAIRAAQDKRDAEDARRPMGALRPADDAKILESDGMTPDEVLAETLKIVRQCRERVT
ncbi:MAG: (d)CMP kinase [Planctomycetota bacterium]